MAQVATQRQRRNGRNYSVPRYKCTEYVRRYVPRYVGTMYTVGTRVGSGLDGSGMGSHDAAKPGKFYVPNVSRYIHTYLGTYIPRYGVQVHRYACVFCIYTRKDYISTHSSLHVGPL